VIAVKFDGGLELARTLAALPEAVSRKVQTDALVAGGERIRKRAAELAPRGTEPGPDLADYILCTPVKRTSSEIEAGVDATAGIGVPKRFFYDVMLEFGTKHAPRAQPFYRPALDEAGPLAIKTIAAELWAALAKRGAVGSRGGSSGGGLV
jgi:HK97 gp10 family phage protein